MCEARSVNRQIKFPQNIRERADVVFMSVCENKGREIVAILLKKIEIRDRDIDAIRRLFRESHPRVNDDHLIGVPDAHAVHPEFANTAKWNYLYSLQLFTAVNALNSNAQ